MKRLWPFVVALVLFVVLLLGVLFDSYGDRIPGAARMCESGLGVAGGASCQLAIATRDTVAKVPGAEKTFAITVLRNNDKCLYVARMQRSIFSK